MQTIYLESGLIRLSGCAQLYPLDQYIAESVVREGGLNRVIIRHVTEGVFNDETQLWENILTYANWDQYQDDSSTLYGVDEASTIAALNVLLSS